MKKFIAVLLAVIMVVSIAMVPASASEKTQDVVTTSDMESVFADIIIPQIAKKDVKERQNILVNLSMHHSSVLRTVQKYIPNIQNTPNAFEDMSDERLEKMRSEIGAFGIDFKAMQEAARRVNEGHKLGPRIAADFIGAVDSFYEENEQVLKADRSSALTPLLRSQLEGFVDKLDVLEAHAVTEQDKANVEGFKKFLKAYFHKVPDLDSEIEKIRTAKKEKKNEHAEKKEEPVVQPKKEGTKEEHVDGAPVHSPEVEEILDDVKQAGQAAAKTAVHEKPEDSKEEAKEQRTFDLKDRFVIDNITGEVIDQHGATMYEKVRNIVQATGDFDYLTVPEVAEKRSKATRSFTNVFMNDLNETQKKILEKAYGKNWVGVVQQAYIDGYNQAIEFELGKAKLEGQSLRAENMQRTNETAKKTAPVSFEEVKFVYENFDIKTNDEGQVEVIDKVTGQVVTNKATVTKALFAREWVNAAGAIQKEDGTVEIHPELAFSQETKDIAKLIYDKEKKNEV